MGGPELKITYQSFFKSNSSVADFEAHLSTTRACSDSEFWSFQFDAFEWNSQYYHDYIYVTFVEEDGGTEVEETVNVPLGNGMTGTLKIKYKEDDDVIRKNYPIQKPNCPPSFWQSCAEYRANDDFWFYSTSDYQT